MKSMGKTIAVALNRSLGLPPGQRWLAVSLRAGLLALAAGCGLAEALTDEELVEIRDRFAARRDSYLRGYLEESMRSSPLVGGPICQTCRPRNGVGNDSSPSSPPL